MTDLPTVPDLPTAPGHPTVPDLPTVTDPALYGDGAPYADPAPRPERPPAGSPSAAGDTAVPDRRAEAARAGDPVAAWPCAGCGRPVPQPVRGARTVRYCQDTGGRCERAARETRENARESAGLTGQVAWTWEMVERLEGVADRLAGSLSAELSVSGVERRVADARADAAGHIAIAQRERDASQRQAEVAWQETAAARTRAETAEQDAAAARAEAERTAAERDAAREERREAADAADASAAARLAAESERDRVASREGELLAALETARSELVALHARLSETETIAEGRRVEAAEAQRAAGDLRSAVRDAEAKRGQAVADLDQTQARAREFEQHNWQLSRTVEELRAAVRALTAERDAARTEADRARRRVDALTRLSDGAPQGGPAVDREPLTGVHTLAPMDDPLNRSSYADPLGDPRQRGRNGYHLPNAG
ncbi:chromosome segregation ATPase [Actinomadura rubrisoli]|uniref:Chromosome segregation ATPase n=2 Tax=Actinomadura rubrisoli TaxID=2530368 RepID=A0A4R5A2P9_9ACTN|nr:chromosome segregation ATPase [Actinomadura rubrisoli]TDD65735.1 chromosome segregation ATPase [Actinomadura rubrisoli]